MANKADKAASRGHVPMYATKCEWWPLTIDLAALDAPTAARIHAERLWRSGKWPIQELPEGRKALDRIRVTVEGPEGAGDYTVRVKMEAVFEVTP